jgi:hypothetical protein
VSHFPRFFSFLAKIQVTQCVFLIFHVFHYFLPYSRSYSVWFSFCTFYSVSRYNPGPIECISHISQFSLCLAIIQVLQCAFLILHDFHCFYPYFNSYHVSLSFSSFVGFLAICHVLQCAFLIFHVCQFSLYVPWPTVYIFSFFTFFIVSHHIPGHIL